RLLTASNMSSGSAVWHKKDPPLLSGGLESQLSFTKGLYGLLILALGFSGTDESADSRGRLACLPGPASSCRSHSVWLRLCVASADSHVVVPKSPKVRR